MVLLIPNSVEAAFLEIARGNFDGSGHVETLAYFIGVEDNGCDVVTEVIVPNQVGSASRVDDSGIDGFDSIQWALTFSKTATEYGERVKFLAWVHTHVQGCLVGFSSVDLHSQFALEQTFGNVVGIVMRHAAHDRQSIHPLSQLRK